LPCAFDKQPKVVSFSSKIRTFLTMAPILNSQPKLSGIPIINREREMTLHSARAVLVEAEIQRMEDLVPCPPFIIPLGTGATGVCNRVNQFYQAPLMALGRFEIGAPLSSYNETDLVFLPYDNDRYLVVSGLRSRMEAGADPEMVLCANQGPPALPNFCLSCDVEVPRSTTVRISNGEREEVNLEVNEDLNGSGLPVPEPAHVSTKESWRLTDTNLGSQGCRIRSHLEIES
jgi:hypothetical protein